MDNFRKCPKCKKGTIGKAYLENSNWDNPARCPICKEGFIIFKPLSTIISFVLGALAPVGYFIIYLEVGGFILLVGIILGIISGVILDKIDLHIMPLIRSPH